MQQQNQIDLEKKSNNGSNIQQNDQKKDNQQQKSLKQKKKNTDQQNNIDDDSDEDAYEKLKQQRVQKSVQIGKEFYTYNGPPDQAIDDLFYLLQERQNTKSGFEILNKIKEKIKEVEDWFENKCFIKQTILGTEYKFTFTIYDLFIFVVYWIITFIYIFSFVSSLANNSDVKSSEWKSSLIKYLLYGGLSFTSYGLVVQQISNKLVHFILFIIFFVAEDLWMLYSFNVIFKSDRQPDYSMSTILIHAIPMTICIHWLIGSFLYRLVRYQYNFMLTCQRNTFGEFNGCLFTSGYCIIFPYFVFTSLLNYFLFSSQFNALIIVNTVFGVMLVPLFILIVLSWWCLQYRMFTLPLNNIQRAILNIKDEIEKGFKKIQKIQQQQTCYTWYKRNIGKIASISVGLIYIGAEFFLIISLVNDYSSGTSSVAKNVILIFEIVAIPFFLIFGICISVSERRQSDTYLYIPLFCASLPMLGLIPLSNYFNSISDLQNLTNLVLYGPAGVITFWLILAICGVERRHLFMSFILFLCLFIALPMGFLLPLSLVDYFGDSSSTIMTISYLILIIGVIIIILGCLGLLGKYAYEGYERKKNKKNLFNLLAISYMNLRGYGFLVNSTAFTIGYGLLAYVYYNASSNTKATYEVGLLLGMLIILPILFILINMALRQKSAELKDDEIDEKSLQQLLPDKKKEIEEKLNIKRQQKNFVIAGIIFPIVLMIPFIILTSQINQQIAFLIILICIPLCFGIYWTLAYIKNSNQKYQNFFQPFVVAICWCCCFCPFMVMVPVTVSLLENYTETFGNFMRYVVATTVILCMCGVTTFAVFFHLILNKIEMEKQMKFVTSRVQQILIENSVKSDSETLSLLYERFLRLELNVQTMSSQLETGVPVNWWRERDKQITYSHYLVTEIVFNQLKNKDTNSKSNDKDKEQDEGFVKDCIDILLCRIGMIEDEEDKKTETQSVSQQNDTQEFNIEELLEGDGKGIIDQFLPSEIKKSIFNQYNSNVKQKRLFDYLEQNEDDLILDDFMNNQGEYKQKEDVFSSKTMKFRQYNSGDPSNIKKKEHKYSYFGNLLQQDEKLRIELFHDIWNEFSNNDNFQQSSLIYTDWIELMRITHIYLPNERNDDSYLDKQQVDKIYTDHASSPWQHGIFVLNFQEFALACKDLAIQIYPYEENFSKQLKALCVDVFFVNLCNNIQNFASNYKPHVRQFMSKYDRQDEINNSPFYFDDQRQNLQKQDSINFINQNIPEFKIHDQATIQNNLDSNNQYLTTQTLQKLGSQTSISSSTKEDKQKLQRPCHQRCIFSICRSLRTFFCVYPALLIKKIQDSLKAFQQDEDDKRQNQFKQMIQQETKRMAPSWEIICDMMIQTMVSADADYQKLKKKGIEYKMDLNLNNINALFGKYSEIYEICLIAFLNNVVWLPNQEANNPESAKNASINGSGFNTFQNLFYLACIMSAIYAMLANTAIKHAQNDTLGLDKDGNVAQFPHPQFFLTFALQLLGGGQFMNIMQTFIDTFICQWKGYIIIHNIYYLQKREGPWPLYRTSDITCLSDQHILMMIIAIVFIVVYYPVATFMFPNFQFLDKGLDIKYDPSFLVIQIQFKLLILAVQSFFSSFKSSSNINNIAVLATASTLMLSLALICLKIRPCLIQFQNIVESAGYFIAAILNGVGMIQLITGNTWLGVLVAFPLVGFTVFLTIYIYFKQYYVKPPQKTTQVDLQDLPSLLFLLLNHQIYSIKGIEINRREKTQLEIEEEEKQKKIQEHLQSIQKENKDTSKKSESIQDGEEKDIQIVDLLGGTKDIYKTKVQKNNN